MTNEISFIIDGISYDSKDSIPLPQIDSSILDQNESKKEQVMLANETVNLIFSYITIKTNFPAEFVKVEDIPERLGPGQSKPFNVVIFHRKILETKQKLPEELQLIGSYKREFVSH